jgi:hypothetical protein
VRRARERREFGSHPPPVGRPEIVFAVVAAVVVSLVNLLAIVTDLQAFAALATPLLICWLALCLLCCAGLLVAAGARRRRIDVPLYFRLLLALGVLAGIFTLSPALRVLTKNDAQAEQPPPAANLDLRNREVKDVSFAGRSIRHSNFSGATLSHVDFSEANLSEADFRDTTLVDVDLSGANLCGADIRGADLRRAKGLESVADWSYVFYDGRTLFPKSLPYPIIGLPGPIEDTGRDLLYMCSSGQVRRIES